MGGFRRCVAVINTGSGERAARAVFGSALQQFLDRAGIVHRDVLLPDENLSHALAQHAASADAIIVCGGDGTVSSVANAIAASPGGALLTRPLVVVPCGVQNSIAASLGLTAAERAVSAFAMGRVESVPLWDIRVNNGEAVARRFCSYVALGAFAESVQRLHEIRGAHREYGTLPRVLGNYGGNVAALVTAMRAASSPCKAILSPRKPTESEEHMAAHKLTTAQRTLGPPLRLLIAAQMPLQRTRFSLTPNASHRHETLCVTYATAEASRLRMLHLLTREASAGEVIAEDGVGECRAVASLQLRLGGDETVLLVDGETLRLPPNATVDVQRAPCNVLFATC